MKERLKEKDASLKEKDASLKEKDALMKERLNEKDASLKEKDALMKERLNEKDALLEEKNIAMEKTRADFEKRFDENINALKEKNALIQGHLEEINKSMETTKRNYEKQLDGKDMLIQQIQDCRKLENDTLSTMLERANTEALKLAGSLSVRGMIEKIEHQYSDRRRKEGSNASREVVWMEILEGSERIKEAVIRTCVGRNVTSKVDAAIEAIAQIYKHASDEVHNAGYDEILIRRSKLSGIQLEVLRGLCAATHYATREVD